MGLEDLHGRRRLLVKSALTMVASCRWNPPSPHISRHDIFNFTIMGTKGGFNFDTQTLYTTMLARCSTRSTFLPTAIRYALRRKTEELRRRNPDRRPRARQAKQDWLSKMIDGIYISRSRKGSRNRLSPHRRPAGKARQYPADPDAKSLTAPDVERLGLSILITSPLPYPPFHPIFKDDAVLRAQSQLAQRRENMERDRDRPGHPGTRFLDAPCNTRPPWQIHSRSMDAPPTKETIPHSFSSRWKRWRDGGSSRSAKRNSYQSGSSRQCLECTAQHRPSKRLPAQLPPHDGAYHRP